MFETLKRLWNEGRLKEDGLRKAVDEKKWITPEQFTEISNIPYTSEA